jgi:hypothetical protein
MRSDGVTGTKVHAERDRAPHKQSEAEYSHFSVNGNRAAETQPKEKRKRGGKETTT